MFAQGFAIKKELINGKPVMEEGIMGQLNKDGASIVEVNNGSVKYTELSPQDIQKLISVRSSSSDLMERLTPLLEHHHRHRTRHHGHRTRHHGHRTRHHHTRRGVARGHTKKHKKRHHTHKRKHRRKHRRKHQRTKRHRRK